ncbi:MAG: GH3 auxin-responsive promoter family protein [Hydrogenophilaceae bacterium]
MFAHRPLRRKIISYFAKRNAAQVATLTGNAAEAQHRTLLKLIAQARETLFGSEHGFDAIAGHADFIRRVPLTDYEGMKPYLDRLMAGDRNILWPGRPVYWAFTSGTTSGAKHIPIYPGFIKPYSRGGRDALSRYIAETKNCDCIMGRTLYFSHDIEYGRINGIPVSPISGIAYAHIPALFRRRLLPSERVNRMANFEEKIALTAKEALGQNITMVTGIPAWIQMFFNTLNETTGRSIKELFPNLSLLVHGSANIEPYRRNIENALGGKIDTLEIYPATEGFFGYQDRQDDKSLLLNLAGETYYEFVPADGFDSQEPKRLSLGEVETGVNYAVVISNCTGLWGYLLGDTIRFTSLAPYRFLITGRTRHFLSTCGEHIITEEAEWAMAEASQAFATEVVEFTVAPGIDKLTGLPLHRWLIEFDDRPPDLDRFASRLDYLLGVRNINYKEFREANILLRPLVEPIARGGFAGYLKSIGKLGGQHKMPHLSNDTAISDALSRHKVP